MNHIFQLHYGREHSFMQVFHVLDVNRFVVKLLLRLWQLWPNKLKDAQRSVNGGYVLRKPFKYGF